MEDGSVAEERREGAFLAFLRQGTSADARESAGQDFPPRVKKLEMGWTGGFHVSDPEITLRSRRTIHRREGLPRGGVLKGTEASIPDTPSPSLYSPPPPPSASERQSSLRWLPIS
jgi:hypothetical protein